MPRKKRGRPELVLGFVSLPCAGKGAAIEYLVSRWQFYASSLSDRIREEIRRRGEKISRSSLQAVGGELRENFGPEVLARRTWEKVLASGYSRVAIDSIRAKEEAEFLKKQPGFYLVAVLADPQTRFQRIVARGQKTDPQTWKEFCQMEERDKRQEGRDIESCLKLADMTIDNNGPLKGLYQRLENILATLGFRLKKR